VPVDQHLLEIQQRLALVESRLEQLFEHLDLKPRGGEVGGEADPAQDPEIQDLLAKGNEVQAVKRYRELTGADIAEAGNAIQRAQSAG
jgi:ribosomal protein L7/L12